MSDTNTIIKTYIKYPLLVITFLIVIKIYKSRCMTHVERGHSVIELKSSESFRQIPNSTVQQEQVRPLEQSVLESKVLG